MLRDRFTYAFVHFAFLAFFALYALQEHIIFTTSFRRRCQLVKIIKNVRNVQK